MSTVDLALVLNTTSNDRCSSDTSARLFGVMLLTRDTGEPQASNLKAGIEVV